MSNILNQNSLKGFKWFIKRLSLVGKLKFVPDLVCTSGFRTQPFEPDIQRLKEGEQAFLSFQTDCFLSFELNMLLHWIKWEGNNSHCIFRRHYRCQNLSVQSTLVPGASLVTSLISVVWIILKLCQETSAIWILFFFYLNMLIDHNKCSS